MGKMLDPTSFSSRHVTAFYRVHVGLEKSAESTGIPRSQVLFVYMPPRLFTRSPPNRDSEVMISLELATIVRAAVLLGCVAGLATPTSKASGAVDPPDPGPDRRVGKTPALGWNSWNIYRCEISDARTRAVAGQFVSLGLKDAGYTYVNIDDCWSDINGRDASTNRIKPDASKFPDGIKNVADHVHSQGLLFGIYGDAGERTCAGYPGSLGYEVIDAQTWAEWGVDYLKYDNCNIPGNWTDDNNVPSDYDWYNSNTALRYRRMTAALNAVASIRPIEYGLCNGGWARVWTWGARVGHSWRMYSDSAPDWDYVMRSIKANVEHLQYVDFWAHNDMDMMEIGNGDLTLNEERTHFAIWAALKSPILLGADLSKLSSDQLAIIKNAELLAFSQDTTIGAPAKPYKTEEVNPPEFYAGKSSKGMHVFVMNTGGDAASQGDHFLGDLGTFSGNFTVTVETHDTAAFLLV